LFRHTILRNLYGMATLEEKIKAELLLRSMVTNEGLPDPDHIEYGHTCIRAIWTESKLAVVIDIDDLSPDIETLEDLGVDPTALGCDADAGADGWDEAA
jgi:hypothetical protein